jgi:hypothetical protein
MFMCDQPADHSSTVQPEQEEQNQAPPEEPVETAVESIIQPDFQPALSAAPESNPSRDASPVERLKAIQDEEHTSRDSEAERVYAFALAEAMGFPPLAIRQGETVTGGRGAWSKFAAMAHPEKLRAAILRLEAQDGPT